MNSVFIATSLDGYIADRDGGLDWLVAPSDPANPPDPAEGDHGFGAFLAEIDALVMGRTTFETVAAFDGDWPYPCPVFVLSRTLTAPPAELADRVEMIDAAPRALTAMLTERGYPRLYVDGGRVVQSFLAEDLIDRLIITQVPVLLGGGTPLFGTLPAALAFRHRATETLPGGMVQSTYERVRP